MGERTVGLGADLRDAPELMIRYRCPKCGLIEYCDAYKGVPRCVECKTFLNAQALVQKEDPLADIKALRKTQGNGGVM